MVTRSCTSTSNSGVSLKHVSTTLLTHLMKFQYSKAAKLHKQPTFCLFLNSHAYRWKYKCTGIKHCEYLQNRLKAYSHSEVTEEMYNNLRKIQSSVPKRVLTTGQKQAQAYKHVLYIFLACFANIFSRLYISINRRFNKGCCTPQKDTCKPQVGRQQEQVRKLFR
jgi:hypothetical protein